MVNYEKEGAQIKKTGTKKKQNKSLLEGFRRAFAETRYLTADGQFMN